MWCDPHGDCTRELGVHPDRQTVRPLRDCLISTNFVRDCLVIKNLALSLRNPDSPKRPTATNHQIVEPYRTRKVYRWCGKACRGVSHVVILLRFCALGSGAGFCGKYSFGHETVFSWGCKPNSTRKIEFG